MVQTGMLSKKTLFMTIIFITRTKSKEDFNTDEFIDLISKLANSGIKKIYAVSNFEYDNYKPTGLNPKIAKLVEITVVKDDNPISPVALNSALERMRKDNLFPDALLIASKEVFITQEDVQELANNLEGNEDLLVVGYRLKINKKNQSLYKELNKELNSFYSNKLLIANRVPWNTCAIWRYQWFDRYVKEFDKITKENPFDSVHVCIDNACYDTPHEGMEDGLAIAKAVSEAWSRDKKKLYFKLIRKNPLPWSVKTKKMMEHRKKLARKNKVLRDFMAVKEFKEEDLLAADLG